ncbi:MAG: MBL fold metallo-hydrolase [Steroidobacteraceae bacterium]|nr:MBL fold metallo-hydrolase [Steroidobacteraceae bacterium]
MTSRTFRLDGPFRIDRLVEFEGPFRSATHLFPPATEAEVRATATARDPRFYDLERDLLVMAFHALLVRTPTHTLIVDTCLGNDKSRPKVPEWNQRSGAFLEDLTALGVRPGDVDYVLCTHLHADHVGWHTRLVDGRWVPTFPRARYLFARREIDHLRARVRQEGPMVHHGIWDDGVQPVLDAGLAVLVEDGVHEVVPGVSLHPAPGHTPGTVMVRLDDGRHVAWLIGDVVHHPIQVERPDWFSRFCDDPTGACASRGRLLELVADTDMRLIPAHFPAPTSVRIRRDASGYRLDTD